MSTFSNSVAPTPFPATVVLCEAMRAAERSFSKAYTLAPTKRLSNRNDLSWSIGGERWADAATESEISTVSAGAMCLMPQAKKLDRIAEHWRNEGEVELSAEASHAADLLRTSHRLIVSRSGAALG